MKMLKGLIVALFLSSAAYGQIDIKEAADYGKLVNERLSPIADAQAKHNDAELSKILKDPAYTPDYVNDEVKQELGKLVAEVIDYRGDLTSPLSSDNARCEASKNKYKEGSFKQLKEALAKYQKNSRSQTDYAQVVIGALSLDGANFLAGPVFACGKL